MAYNNMYGYNMYPNYQSAPQQMQNGFVSVRSIEEAFNYPVAPGNSITFKDENNPFVYTKTRGFSPLEQPTFERYRLVKIEPSVAQEQPQQAHDYGEQINRLWEEVNALKDRLKGARHDKSADADTVSAVRKKSAPVHAANGSPDRMSK